MLRVSLVLRGFACAAFASSAVFAQTAAELQRPAGNRYISVGCLSRETPAPAGRGAAAAPVYIITDSRGETPLVYRLEGDATELAAHIGHTIQVEGPLSAPPAGATG